MLVRRLVGRTEGGIRASSCMGLTYMVTIRSGLLYGSARVIGGSSPSEAVLAEADFCEVKIVANGSGWWRNRSASGRKKGDPRREWGKEMRRNWKARAKRRFKELILEKSGEKHAEKECETVKECNGVL